MSTRLSPEAPVPVVDILEKIQVPGGAANTAVNLKSLGADVTVLSVTGNDTEGQETATLLREKGIHTWGILRSPDRHTLVKSRIVSGAQILTRFDSGSDSDISACIEERLINYLKSAFQYCDAVLISDYCKGVITANILNAMKVLTRKTGKFLGVDSRRLGFFRELQPQLVKPNYAEAVALLNVPVQAIDRCNQILPSGQPLYEATGATHVAVTLDEEGAVVFKEGAYAHHVPVDPISRPNVVGAGDTFISAFLLALISDADAATAAEIASKAAAIAIRKDGTASCSCRELEFCYTRSNKHVGTIGDLAAVCEMYRQEGRRIVFTNGCFDILHSGHVSYLNRARQLGDVLIVGINRDDSIRRIKGKGRPVNPLDDRVQVLAGLTAIDHIIPFGHENDDTPVELIRVVRPNVFVKGGDYSRDKLPEAETVESVGGEIVFLPLVPDHSTTSIIQRVHHTSTLAVA